MCTEPSKKSYLKENDLLHMLKVLLLLLLLLRELDISVLFIIVIVYFIQHHYTHTTGLCM
jgi:hypothetical protein